ncbi:uncharacterized protein LOC134215390 [Armigeres subalbatus]|uniref:uncharacterized protein LOC134215390 n=1 Tax=Armigeres subalbatus TaxID=124917 RepID=UPI002ED34B22
MTSHNWGIEETNLMIRKRLELLGCARSDKVYDQISNYLAENHNYYKNAAACQTRFNNLLKTYRSCIKRQATGGKVCKVRFPFFDTFHQYYGTMNVSVDNGTNKCKTEIFFDDLFADCSYAVDGGGGGGGGGDVDGGLMEGDSMMMDSTQTGDEYVESPEDQHGQDGEEELTTSLTVNNGLDDLKLRLMEQKLLYYTNQNMLLQIKQEHYRQKDQDRARGQLMAEEILRVLRGIHTCLKKSLEVKVVPQQMKKPTENSAPSKGESIPVEPKVKDDIVDEEEEAEEEEEADCSSSVMPVDVESGDEEEEEEEEEFNGDGQSGSGGSSEEVIKKPELPRLKVRKNIFPAWNRIQTVLLIKIHCDLRPKFKGYNLFECVSNKLIELHINRTPRDCRTRWNNLFRSYKECRSRLRVNDKAPVKFEYFDEIDAYYKDCQFLTNIV